MELALGVGGLTVAIVVALIALGMQLDERASIRTSLRRLDEFDITDTRDKELLAPLRARTIAPMFKGTVGKVRSVTPVGYMEKLQKKLIQAGTPEPEAVDRFMVTKVVLAALIPVALFLIFGVAKMSGLLGFAVAAMTVFILAAGPDASLNRRVAARLHKMRIALPEILDLLVISVEAGLGFEQALDRVVEAVPGPLTEEFGRMLGEVRAGSSRSDAMRAMEKRVDVAEVRSFILTMLQADTFGVSIGRVLRIQADEMRVKRRQYAQELAQKAPVKMLIPMVFCIFPALFVVVIGPAILQILEQF